MANKTKTASGMPRAKKPHRISQREVESLSLVNEPRKKKSRKKKVVTFWSLPEPIRQRIYRIALVSEVPLDCYQNRGAPIRNPPTYELRKIMPAWLEADAKFDREAAPIYFGESTFEILKLSSLYSLLRTMEPRHLKLIRKLILKVTCRPDGYNSYASLRVLEKLQSLDELSLIVNEKSWLKDQLRRADDLRWYEGLSLTPQLQLRLYFMPGIRNWMALSGLSSVKFLSDKDKAATDKFRGPMKGGFLETVLKPHMMCDNQNLDPELEFEDDASFRFLDLPPELRNRVYKDLLVFPGGLIPSNSMPSSIAGPLKGTAIKSRSDMDIPDSALKVLLVCRQIYDEALGLFYSENHLTFHYPAQLVSFLLDVGPDRSRCIRDLTLFHNNRADGNVHIFETAIRACRALRNLRRLHVIVTGDSSRGWPLPPGGHQGSEQVRSCSYRKGCDALSGMRPLFMLRGQIEIEVRDLTLERALRHQANPALPAITSEPYIKADKNLDEALQHFNLVLALSVKGSHNKLFVEEGTREYYHWWNLINFPAICDCAQKDRVCTEEPDTCFLLPEASSSIAGSA